MIGQKFLASQACEILSGGSVGCHHGGGAEQNLSDIHRDFRMRIEVFHQLADIGCERAGIVRVPAITMKLDVGQVHR